MLINFEVGPYNRGFPEFPSKLSRGSQVMIGNIQIIKQRLPFYVVYVDLDEFVRAYKLQYL